MYRIFNCQYFYVRMKLCSDSPWPPKLPRTLATIILDIVYGHEVRSMDDHYLKLINKASSYFVEGKALGRFWVDFIPLLRYVPPWVPGAAAAKYGAEARPVVEEMFDKPLRDLRSNLNGVSLRDCELSSIHNS